MSSNNMWKLWLFMDPKKTLIAIFAFLIVLGLLIHMVVLSTDLNWMDDQIPVGYQALGASLPANQH